MTMIARSVERQCISLMESIRVMDRKYQDQCEYVDLKKREILSDRATNSKWKFMNSIFSAIGAFPGVAAWVPVASKGVEYLVTDPRGYRSQYQDDVANRETLECDRGFNLNQSIRTTLESLIQRVQQAQNRA